MNKVLLRAVSLLTIVALLLSSVGINAKPFTSNFFSGSIFNRNPSTKAIKDATFQKPIQHFNFKEFVKKDKKNSITPDVFNGGPLSTNNQSTCTKGKIVFTYTNGVTQGNFQNFTVPSNVTQITIEAFGANGGDAPSTNVSAAENGKGGIGVYLKGTFSVTPGDNIYMIVGQKGGDEAPGNVNFTYSGGGGGGTFVSLNDAGFTNQGKLLLAAGGGGGGGYGDIDNVNGYDKNANTGKDGYYGANTSTWIGGSLPDFGGPGGNNGNGGNSGLNSGGGTGFVTNGQDDSFGDGINGLSPQNGAQGGIGLFSSYNAPYNLYQDEYGGYGGGAGTIGGGGGGGGYSGGGGGKSSGFGGGGGSFVSPSVIGSPVLTALGNQNNTYTGNSGDGVVVITYDIPVPVITVTGNSNSINNGSLTTSTTNNTDFGSIAPNASVTKTFTIHNTGTEANLDISNITLNNAQFVLTNGTTTYTIPPGGSQNFDITYNSPSTTGTNTATITINSNDCVTNPYTYLISGTTGSVCQTPSAPTATNGSNCGPGTVNISAAAGVGETIDWYAAASGGTALATGTTSFTTPSINATTTYYAEARNISGGCVSATRTAVTATINDKPNVTISPASISIVNGNSTTLTASGASAYTWTPSTGLSATSGASVNANPAATTTYTVTGTDANGCSNTSTVTVTVSQNPATALNFDGVNDIVTIPRTTGLDLAGNIFTIEYWAKPNAVDGNFHWVISKDNGNSDLAYLSGISSNNKWRFIFRNFSFDLSSTTTAVAGTWYHIACTYDGTTAKLYVNGVLEASQTVSVTSAANTSNIALGARTAASPQAGQFFNGDIDEVRIWSRALCLQEISNNKNCELGSNQTDLQAYYQLNAGYINANNAGYTSAFDNSGNNNNGTLSNFALNDATSNWSAGTVGGSCTAFVPDAASITGANTICISSTTQLTATPTGGNWVSSNTSIASVNSSGLVTGNSAGTSTITYTSPCGAVATFSITVNATPTVNAVSNQEVCHNGTATAAITFSGSLPGTVYTWTNNTPSIGLAASGTGDIASFVAQNPGNTPVTATITVTPTYTNNGVTCTGSPVTFTITVNPIPTFNAIADQTVCAGAATTAVTFVGNVAGTTYNWSGGAGIGLANGSGATLPSFTAVNTTGSPVTANILVISKFQGSSVSCGTSRLFAITVNPLTIPAFTQIAAICSGESLPSLPTTSTNGITGTWSPALNNTATTTYTFTPTAGQCATTTTMTITVNPIPVATITAGGPTTFCPGGSVVLTSSSATGNVWSTGATTQSITVGSTGTYSVTVSDGGSCSATSAALSVTVQDITAPVTPTLANITGECSATAPVAITMDACAGTITGTTNDPLTYTTQGDHIIHWTFTDPSGNSTTADQHVIIQDVTPPTINCPVNISTTANTVVAGQSGAMVSFSATGSDNCGTPTITYSQNPGTFFPVGTTTVTVTADDGHGHTATCSFDVTVTCSVTTPTINASGATTFCPGGSVTLTSSSATGNVWSTHATTQSITVSNTGSYSVTVSDGGSCSATSASIAVTAQDVTAPAIPILANITGECSATAPVAITMDACAGTITGTTNDPLTYNTQGDHIIHWTFTDPSGNSTTADQHVIIQDVTPPTINCPANISTTANTVVAGQSGAMVSFSATGSDNCGTPTITYSQNPGTFFPVGTTTVTVTADDGHGHTATCSFDVTVTCSVTTPTINASGATAFCPGGSVILTSSSATRNVWSTHATTQSITVSNTGSYSVTVSDGGSCSATSAALSVTVQDITAPVTPTLANITGECSATAPVATTMDACAGTITGTTNDPLTYTTQGDHIIHWTFTDPSGNSTTADQHVIIQDVTPPTINCPVNISTTANTVVAGQSGAMVSFSATGSDNCGTPTITYSQNPGTFFPVGTTTVTVTADDGHGNTATCHFDVIVNCVTPVFTTCSSDISKPTDPGVCGAVVNYVSTASGDPATTYSYSFSGATIGNGNGTGAGAFFNTGVTAVTVTASNICGNATCSFNVTVTDTENPVITGTPSTINKTNDAGTCGAVVTWTALVATDNCGVVSFTSDHHSGDVFSVGTTTVTYTATDAAGNTTTTHFDVVVTDNESPIITVPGDVTHTADAGLCSFTFGTGGQTTAAPGGNGYTNSYGGLAFVYATATDNCGVTVTGVRDDGQPLEAAYLVGVTTITWTATDIHGNAVSGTQKITVTDDENPVIAGLPSNINKSNDAGVCGAVVNWTAATATDNCPGVTIVSDHHSGDLFPVGNTTVTYTASDAHGHTVTGSFIVTVTDTEKPVITGTPSTINKTNDAGTCGAVVTWTALKATDNCAVLSFTSDHHSGDVFPIGATTVHYTATDAKGNTTNSSFDVVVTDNEAPTVTCPSGVTVTANTTESSVNGAHVTYGTATAADNCGVQSIVYSKPSGGFFPVGDNVVDVTVTDIHGNVTHCSFHVIVKCVTPVFTTCPSDISKPTDAGVCGAVVNYVSSASGDPATTYNYTFSGATTASGSGTGAGALFNTGVTTVTVTASNICGNATCSFTVTVTDTEKPKITAPGDWSVVNDEGVCGATIPDLGTPIVSDNCGIASFTNDHPSSYYPVGTTIVTWTVTDIHGNISDTVHQSVTVIDNEKPTITAPANITVNNDPGKCGANVPIGMATAADNCGVFSVTNDHPSNFYPVGITIVTWTVLDNHGFTTKALQTIKVIDNEPPVIKVPSDVTHTADAGLCSFTFDATTATQSAPGGNGAGIGQSGISLGMATATDNCAVTVVGVREDGQPLDAPYPVGVTTIRWTATDIHGNTVSGTQKVTITDDENPVIVGLPANISVGNDLNTCGAVVNWIAATASDNCPGVTIVSDHQPGEVFPMGTTLVTYTATDAHEHSVTGSFNVTVSDVQKPMLQCPADITVNASTTHNGQPGANVTFAATASDNCGVPVISYSVQPGSFFPVGTTTVTTTADDGHGNTVSCSFNVTVNCVPTVVTVSSLPTRNTFTGGVPTSLYLGYGAQSTILQTTVGDNSTYSYAWSGSGASMLNSTNSNAPLFTPTEAGSYLFTVVATNSFGCQSSSSLSICVTDIRVPGNQSSDDDDKVDDHASCDHKAHSAKDCPHKYEKDNKCDHKAHSDKDCPYKKEEGKKDEKDDHNKEGGNKYKDDAKDYSSKSSTKEYDNKQDDHHVTCDHKAHKEKDCPHKNEKDNKCDHKAHKEKDCPYKDKDSKDDDHHDGKNDHQEGDGKHGQDNYKVFICHVPPGNPGKHITLSISINAVAAHLANHPGDRLGSCEQAPCSGYTDLEKPEINCPPSITVDCSSSLVPSVTGKAKATDNSGVVTVTYTDTDNQGSDANAANYYNYVITRTWKATDPAGNTSVCTQMITVRDQVKPNINCPGSVTLACTGDISPATTGTATATDNSNGPVTITYSDKNGEEGIYRTWTATDASGNYATCTQKITVRDDVKPVITAPADVTVQCGTSYTPSVTGTATATDNCSAVTITYSDYTKYNVVTRTWKATDASGNYSTDVQKITIVDNDKPIITAPADKSISCGASTEPKYCGGSATGRDGCSDVTITYSDAMSGNVIVRTWKATDASGNYSTAIQNITIIDNVKPVITDPKDYTIGCGVSTEPKNCGGSATATDNCSTPTVTYSDVTNGNVITRTWKATDAAGNYSTSTQIITVVDNVKPVITDVPDITVSCSGSTDPSVIGRAGATDACSGVTVTYSDVTNGNVITRTWKAIDAAGNYSTSVQTITKGSPFTISITSVPTNSTYTGGSVTNLYLGYGAQSTVLNVGSLPSSGAPYTYAWSGAYVNKLSSVNTSAPVFTPSSFGYYTFSVLVTNRFGCTATASISICVTDIRVSGCNGTKVYVCHTPKGKYAKPQTLEVPINQVSSHILYENCGSDGKDRLGTSDQSPCNTTNETSITSVVTTSATKESSSVSTEEELKVTVMPNPSTTYFTLKLESKYRTPVNLRVMDANGRVIDAKSQIGPNSTIQIGHNYSSGTYYAEMIQGTRRKVIQLIKGRG